MTGSHLPNPSSLVTRTGHEELSISRELEGVDLLLMTGEEMTDALLLDVPNLRSRRESELSPDNSAEVPQTHSDLPVFRSRRQVLAVRAEAYTPDVEVAGGIRSVVDQDAKDGIVSV